MNNLKYWIEAMRLRTLPVSVAGVIAGTACAIAYRAFRPVPAFICLLFALLAQIASNFANEYFDYVNGLDRPGRDGFRRGVTEGDIPPRAMLRATLAVIALDCLVGLSLLCYGDWWIILAGIAVALFAIAYSAGPYPLSHHGLGDIAVIIFFGLIPVTLTCYLQTGQWDWHSISLPVSVSVGLMAANVLVVNNYRDVEDDRAVNKHTTVVLFGRRIMSIAYLCGGLAAIGLTIWYLWPLTGYAILLPSVPYVAAHLFIWFRLCRSSGKEFNPLLGMTAVNLLLFSVLLIISCAFFVE